MKFDVFKEKYFNYIGKGVRVSCPYSDENSRANIELIGLENHGGLQKWHIENKNNICNIIIFPDSYVKVDPKYFRLNNEDIELLDLFDLKIGVEQNSIIDYLKGECDYIWLCTYEEKGCKFMEPSVINNFLENIDNNPKYSKQEEDILPKDLMQKLIKKIGNKTFKNSMTEGEGIGFNSLKELVYFDGECELFLSSD